MLGRDEQRRAVGLQHAGVGDEAHAGGLGGLDDVAVLHGALADLVARDEHDLVDAGERGGQGGDVGVGGDADLHALLGERRGLGLVAHDGDDLGRGHALEQLGDDAAAELAGGSGDGDGHGVLLGRWGDYSPDVSTYFSKALPVG